jgi:hypothetical protein
MAERTEPTESSGAERELQLLSHLRIAAQVERAAELAERSSGAITARSAS